MENINQSPQAVQAVNQKTVNRTESDKMSESVDFANMRDRTLVKYVTDRMIKFLAEIRPGLIELHTRFTQKRARRLPYMGYTNRDLFCSHLLNYTGRHHLGRSVH